MDSKVELITKNASKTFPIIYNKSKNIDFRDYNSVFINEISEKELKITVPIFLCSMGHILVIYLFDKEDEVKNIEKIPSPELEARSLMIEGEIIALEQIDENKITTTLALRRGHIKGWQNYLNERESKQNKISDIFDKYKV